MKVKYTEAKLSKKSLNMVDRINTIIENYLAQGFHLTVRQLYYQLVARDIIPNTLQSYKSITGLVNDARMCGLIDWDAIEDRTREVWQRSRWASGENIIEVCASQFHMDMWENQDTRVIVAVEKEALAGVMQKVCQDLDLPLLAARGYPSVTVLRDLALNTIRPTLRADQKVRILHLGDHDPSGIDMTRDLNKRLSVFVGGDWKLKRIALNMDQIKELDLPENPAKSTDSRFQNYVERFGDFSWELDALEPQRLVDLVRSHTEPYIDREKWRQRFAEIQGHKDKLRWISNHYDELCDKPEQE